MAEHDDIGVIALRRAGALFLMLFLTLASLPAFADELVEGARGEEVERFQQRLADLGYLDGSVDGIFGKQTTEAVSAFQDLNGLTGTGLVDADTREAVFGAQARSLRISYARGDEGDGVRLLQERLVFLGFLTDDADGQYGKNTQSAVEDYQEHLVAQGLTWVRVTGTATSVTQEYLFNESRSTYLYDLHLTDEDAEVRRLERRLHALG